MNLQLDKNGLTEEEFLETYQSDKYPRPSLTADICIVAREENLREILLIRRGGHPYLGCWALPGGFANREEPLEDTAARELTEETGITGVDLRLTGVYSAPGRDPRGWVVSAAYAAVVDRSQVEAKAGDDAAETGWFRIEETDRGIQLIKEDTVLRMTGAQGAGETGLAFDHWRIIADALAVCGITDSLRKEPRE